MSILCVDMEFGGSEYTYKARESTCYCYLAQNCEIKWISKTSMITRLQNAYA